MSEQAAATQAGSGFSQMFAPASGPASKAASGPALSMNTEVSLPIIFILLPMKASVRS